MKTNLGKVSRTARGFEILRFKDRYNIPCSLQMSSLADNEHPGTSAIWFGPEEANPKVMWADAERLGVKTNAKCGWVPFNIPPEVSITTRAHLDREQVESLVKHLQEWLDNGTFCILD